MASVTRNFMNADTIRIEMSADAAEALMQVLQVVTHANVDNPIGNEFDSAWNGLVDLFDVDDSYNSKRFAFKSDEDLIVDR
jgi:hypothetical protein